MVEFDETGMPVPSLASWKQITPTHYRFTLLNTGRVFHHGKRLVAEDVKASYDSILDPKTASPHRSTVEVIKHIEIDGDDQIDYFLKRPDSLFPGYLHIGILPADLIAKEHPFNTSPVGSGPFCFDKWSQQGVANLIRLLDQQTFEFLPVPDPSVRILKLLRGEIDMLQNDLPPELMSYLDGQKGIKVLKMPGNNFSYLGFNLQDEITGQIEIRRAIALGIDRASIIKYFLQDGARPAQALLPPRHWAGAKGLEPMPFDPEKARALLKDLGYSEINPLKITYKTSTDPFRVRLATLIQNQLAQIGIQVEVQSHDWGTFYGDVKQGRFQLYSLSWVGIKTPDIFRYVFHSGSTPPDGANRGRYSSETVDELIDKAEASSDFTQKAQHYQKLQEQLLMDLPYIPLWYEDHLFISRDGVGGYRLARDGNYDGLEHVQMKSR
jgi:peptide/nickel transport system substrate-binding protein